MREGCLKEQKGFIGAGRMMADVMWGLKIIILKKLKLSYYKSI
jgi:hypothetical protein